MWVTMILGIINIIKAISKVLEFTINNSDLLLFIVALITFVISVLILIYISKYKRRREVFSYFEKLEK